VLMYALERSRWRVAVTSSDASQMLIAFNTDSVINPHVDNHLFNVLLTLVAGLPSGWVAADAQAVQGGNVLAKTVVDASTIRFDADPWGGTVTVNRTATAVHGQLRPALRVAPRFCSIPWVTLDGRCGGPGSGLEGFAVMRVSSAGRDAARVISCRR
jgi:hypothetical protein